MNIQTKYKYKIIIASMILMLVAPTDRAIDINKKSNALKHHNKTAAWSLRNGFNYADARIFPSISVSTLFDVPTVQDVTKTHNGLCYTFTNGATIERSGGSIAWRNNNPGCIRYTKNSIGMGAIGTANGFAVFPDEKTGMDAIHSLLLSESYRDLSIERAIHRYAPPHENNTEHYIQTLCGIVGVSRNTKLCNLNDKQLAHVVNTIRTIEGWIVGTEINTPAPRPEMQFINQYAAADNTRCDFVRRAYEKSI